MCATTPATAVRHWHVCESGPGYLPESEPFCATDAEMALDALAHLLSDYSATLDIDFPDDEDSDAAYADAVSEIYCGCRSGTSPEHGDALIRVDNGGLSETIDNRDFAITLCHERDCLTYCPDPVCGTVAPITDSDPWCWCCGTRYVDADNCPWLD